MSKIKHFAIQVSDPSPAMTQTKTIATVHTYHEAVAAARSMWKVTGRSVCLVSAYECGTASTYYWHRIARDGSFIDRNSNSGVPESGTYD